MLGFYEGGGVQNAYRVDPRILVSILTTQVTEEVVQILERQGEYLLKKLQAELSEMEHNFEIHKKKNSKSENEEELKHWYITAKALVVSKIDKEMEDSKNRISFLRELIPVPESKKQNSFF